MAYLWLNAALTLLATAMPFCLYLAVSRGKPEEFLQFQKVGGGTALLCILAGLAICLLGNYPAFFLQDLLGNFGYEASEVLSGESSWPVVILEFLSVAVLVPVMEEFAFRGVVFSALRRYGNGFAVAASALLFSLAHMDLSTALFAFVAGLALAFLYLRTGNLWVCIAVHGLNNGLAVLGNHEEFLFGGAAEVMDIMMMAVPVILGMFCLILLLVRKRDWMCGKGVPFLFAFPLSGGESAGCIVRAPAFWVMVGLTLLFTLALCFH